MKATGTLGCFVESDDHRWNDGFRVFGRHMRIRLCRSMYSSVSSCLSSETGPHCVLVRRAQTTLRHVFTLSRPHHQLLLWFSSWLACTDPKAGLPAINPAGPIINWFLRMKERSKFCLFCSEKVSTEETMRHCTYFDCFLEARLFSSF